MTLEPSPVSLRLLIAVVVLTVDNHCGCNLILYQVDVESLGIDCRLTISLRYSII